MSRGRTRLGRQPSAHDDTKTEDQEDLDARNRRSTLGSVLRNVNGEPDSTANLVLLVDALGLDEELAELTKRSPERQRRLRDVRLELEELAGGTVAQPGE